MSGKCLYTIKGCNIYINMFLVLHIFLNLQTLNLISISPTHNNIHVSWESVLNGDVFLLHSKQHLCINILSKDYSKHTCLKSFISFFLISFMSSFSCSISRSLSCRRSAILIFSSSADVYTTHTTRILHELSFYINFFGNKFRKCN